VNLAATLPGWERFQAAQEILDKSHVQTAATEGKLKQDFDRFLTSASPTGSSAGLSEERKEELFRKFLEWQGSQAH
jgi:hypothetical protein